MSSHSLYHNAAFLCAPLLALCGCASLETASQTLESSSDIAQQSDRAGRNPTSWRLDSPPPKAPPATGVQTVSVPSLVVAPLVEHRLSASTQALAASGVQIIAADQVRPMKSALPNAGKFDPNSASSGGYVSQAAISGETPEPLDPPTLSSSFLSLDFDDNATEAGSVFIPPDPDAAAGPHHVVNVTNVAIAFHDKATGTKVFADSLKDFFFAESPATFTFDPKVVFDPFEGRFVVVTLEREDVAYGDPMNTSKILLAVSDDADPNGMWCTTTIDAKTDIGGTDYWADYPGFSVDEEAIYITNNMFTFFPEIFAGVRLWVVDKAVSAGGLYDAPCGASVPVSIFDPYPDPSPGPGGVPTTTQPAQIHGTAPPGVGTFLVSYSGLSAGPGVPGAAEAVQVVRIDDPLGSPVFTQAFVLVGDIELAAGSLPDAPQMGSGDLIEVNDRRALDAEWFDDILWMTATILPETPPPAGPAPLAPDPVDGGETTAYWWALDTTTLSALTVADQGKISGDDYEYDESLFAEDMFTFFPSVAVNGLGQAGFGYSGSASPIFASSFYTGRNPGEAAGSTQGTALLKAGEAPYCRAFGGPRNRWGDYSGADTDPVDGCFWFYNEYALPEGSPTPGPGICSTLDSFGMQVGRWGTSYGKVCPPDACPADMFLADIDLTGTQTRKAASRISTGGVLTDLTGPVDKKVVVKTGADVTFQAEDLIVFFNGFEVESSATFTAELKDGACDPDPE